MSAKVLTEDTVRTFVSQLLEASGVDAPKAALVARSIVAATLRGVDSHGLQLIPFYLAQIEDHRVDPHATGHVVSEDGAVMVYDGENGLGQVISQIACGHAVRLAKAHGLGLAVTRESNHFGAAAWWARQIATQGAIGVVMCNASSIVAPWQGREARWGTNPLCVSVPGPNEGGWLLDMATTTVAMGKIYKANLNGEPEIPSGWALDSMGVPTTSTEAAMKGSLMPLGGYKGSGLAMMIEILTGVLSGGAFSTALGGFRVKGRPFRVSQFFLAIDVSRLMPLADFEQRMRDLVRLVKSAAPALGYDEVLVAGEPEWRAEARRAADGIPIPDGLWNALEQWAAKLGIATPAA